MSEKQKESLVVAMNDIRSQLLNQGLDFHNHIIIGCDVDEKGVPIGVISAVQAGGYTALGMIQALEALLKNLKESYTKTYVDLISESKNHKDEAVEFDKMTTNLDDDIKKIIASYQDSIIEAIIKKDSVEMARIKREMTEKIKELKGPDFDPQTYFTEMLNNPSKKEESKPKSKGSDLGDISKFH